MQNSHESHRDRAAVSFLLWKCCICFTGTTIKPQLSAVEILNSFPLLSTFFLLTLTLAAGDGRGGREGVGRLEPVGEASCRLAERLSTLRLKESQPSGGRGDIHHARTHIGSHWQRHYHCRHHHRLSPASLQVPGLCETPGATAMLPHRLMLPASSLMTQGEKLWPGCSRRPCWLNADLAPIPTSLLGIRIKSNKNKGQKQSNFII